MNLAVRYEDDAADRRHVPVMVEEVCGLLSAHGPLAFVDVTVGTGGHAEAMLRASKARMLGLDRDAAAIAVARDRLGEFGDRVVLERADFGEVAAVMKQHHFDGADAILADLGMSSYALDDPQRGFSFRLDGPLDMRMDDRQTLQAKDIVNEESAEEIARIIYTYGEERGSRRIARMIVEARRRGDRIRAAELVPERAAEAGELGGHRRAELRSLAYHRALAERLDKPMVHDARHLLWKWQEQGAIDDRYAERWEGVLRRPLGEIRRIIAEDTERGRDLRQSSPFAGMLSEPERRKLLAEIG